MADTTRGDDSTVDASETGPRLRLDDVALPDTVGEQLARAYGTDEAVETGAAWVETMNDALADEVGRPPTADDLCTSPGGDHTFVGDGEEQSYICVLDPLIYPFLTDTPGRVRSETPVRGETVEVEIGETTATASHDDAVVSLGAAATGDPSDPVTFERVYQQVCGYVHVFADREEYDEWTDEVDAATTAVPVADGIAVARELTTALFGEK